VIVHDASRDGLIEAKMNEHLAHLVFHVSHVGSWVQTLGRKFNKFEEKVKVSPKTPILDPNKEHVIFPKERMDRYSIPRKTNGG
jgi:hypothetical protein